MATELRRFELLPNVESVHRPLRRESSSFATTIQQSSISADTEALRSEARSLFVRFAVRWCRANSAGSGRREAA